MVYTIKITYTSSMAKKSVEKLQGEFKQFFGE